VPLPPEARGALGRTGAFTVSVVPSSDWLAIRPNQHQALPWHETVLRPLLRAAQEAWVYELKPGSEVHRIAKPIIERVRGKYRINLNGEPIRGFELLWNASGGQRGSIALVLPLATFPGVEIFQQCQQAFIMGNSTVPHSPSAIRLARRVASDAQSVCCLLSRTNGFEWVSLYAEQERLERLLELAQSLVAQRALYQNAV
jgi:hypothetical protein